MISPIALVIANIKVDVIVCVLRGRLSSNDASEAHIPDCRASRKKFRAAGHG